MLPNAPQLRKIYCLLLIALCLCSQGLAKSAAAQADAGRKQTEIVAPSSAEFASISVKDAAELFGLTRRQFTNELWQAVVIPSQNVLASALEPRSGTSQQILSDFARREVTGVLLN